MTNAMYLGLDVGTSAVKTIVLDELGNIVAEASSPLSVSRPAPRWSEQDPEDWWRGAGAAVLALPAECRARIRGIGLAGQMHGAVLLDRGDRPLRPCILWNDGRSFDECQELERRCPSLRAITGNMAMPGFTAPKLLWIAHHEPHLMSRLSKVLLPKDYVRLCMTGDHASDLSDASGTLWLDVAARIWSGDLLAACGLDEGHMPRLHEGTERTGTLRRQVASDWGMEPVAVFGGGSDNAAGAIGCGIVGDDAALLSLGTSGVLFVATSLFRAMPECGVHAFCHAIPDRWHQMTVHLSAAASLEWVGAAIGEKDVGACLRMAEARSDPFGGRELFLPYLSGERTPHNEPAAMGAFVGLSHDSGRSSLVQAVLEGVAFAFADGLTVLEAAGNRIDCLTVVGGGARSDWWLKTIANALGRTLVRTSESAHVGPALGAARLAHLGHTMADPAQLQSRGRDDFVVQPERELTLRACEKYERYRQLYAAVRPVS